jgi:HPr kinase/phosphorylase
VAGTNDPSGVPPRTLTVAALLAHGDLTSFLDVLAGGDGTGRLLTHPRIQKSGLVLAGHTVGIVPTRAQILGETEVSYLEGLDAPTRDARTRGLFDLGLSVVIVTRGVEPPTELVVHARRTGTPLLVSAHRSSRTIAAVHAALDHLLAPTTQLHGVLIDVHGVGVLLRGPSGVGKSECALVLVERGHRFVADDTVWLSRRPTGEIEGRSPPLLQNHLEVRGVGILNIRDLFGATAVRLRKRLELVVELVPWRADEPYDRLGLDDLTYPVLDTAIPMLRVPVSAGRDVGLIVEVAARNMLLRAAGDHSARKFIRSLEEGLGVGRSGEEGGEP